MVAMETVQQINTKHTSMHKIWLHSTLLVTPLHKSYTSHGEKRNLCRVSKLHWVCGYDAN